MRTGADKILHERDQPLVSGVQVECASHRRRAACENTNDIAGLILKMEYNTEFSVMSEISNSFWRVINVGDTITTSNFVARFPRKRENLLAILSFIDENPLSPAELAIEQAKGNINHKPFPDHLIEALQKDGYFD